MTKTKTLLSSVLIAFVSFLMCFSFSACGSNLSYEKFENDYKNLLKSYENILFDNSGVLNINYSEPLQQQIAESTPEEQLTKLSKNLNDGQAVFEPVLRANFEAVSFFVHTLDSSNVTTASLEKLENKLSALTKTLEQLKKDKQQLESVGTSKTLLLNWFKKDYAPSFLNAILSANDFAVCFLNVYEKEILKADVIEGRITPKYATFQLVKNMTQSATVYSNFVLADTFDKQISGGPNFCNNMLLEFLNIKDVLNGNFKSIRSQNITDDEQNMINSYKLLVEFQVAFDKSLENSLIATSTFKLKTLKEKQTLNTLSTKETICLDAINSLLNQDMMIVKNYNKNIVSAIDSWNNNQGE